MGGLGSGGHNRKSADEHRRRGTFKPARHADRIGDLVTLPLRSEIPTPPNTLGVAGKKLWREIWVGITGLVEGRDEILVERACEARDQEQSAYTDWLQSGRAPDGSQQRRDPRLGRLVAELRKGTRQELALLGMTARDRKTLTERQQAVSSLDAIKQKVVQLRRSS